MSAGAGLVVRADGSGCRLVEYDRAGRVVGQGERISLSEITLYESPKLVPTLAPAAELERLLAKVRAQLSDGSTLTGTDRDPQAAFVALAEVVGGYREAAQRRPDLWQASREAAYLDGGPRGY
jgi:hypothetical protein